MADKIYCIQCGRELKDGLRYCDKCGQSVAKSKQQQSKSTSKRAQAEEIHREQINRKKRREEKEKKKQIKRRKARKRAAVMSVIVAILILGIICALCGYIYMSKNTGIKSVEDVVNEDIAQSSPVTATAQTTTSSVSSAGTSVRNFEFRGIVCPYPENFVSMPAVDGELERREDEIGGAVMTISHESVSGAASDMMTAYYDEVSTLGNVRENRSGSDWYIVTYETDTSVIHRKCVIKDSTALMYNFEYDKSSAKAKDYESLITNLDGMFTSGQDNQ